MATTEVTAPIEVKLGVRTVKFPSPDLQPLEDSNHLLGDRLALLDELQKKGYLFIRGLHDGEEVSEARLAVLDFILNSGEGKLDLKQAWEQGVLDLRCGFYDREAVLDARQKVLEHFNELTTRGSKILDIKNFTWQEGKQHKECVQGSFPNLQGRNQLTESDPVRKIIEGPRPFEFFKTLFGEDARTFDYKWLRAVHREAFTGAHVDSVYMSRGTPDLLTMWTPFGDADPVLGCLAVCEASNRLPGFDRLHETYSKLDVEEANLNGSGWFTCDPFEITEKFGGQWKTTHYKAGDVLIFTMKTVHMSTANQTDRVRISCDTRWQAASEPVDERYVGKLKPRPKFGLYGKDVKEPKSVTMDELREKWGLQ